MAEKIVKIKLNVDSSKGEASIKKTSTQIKALGTTAAASGAAIGAGSKVAAGGILMMGAATAKAAKATTTLGTNTYKLIKNITNNTKETLKMAAVWRNTSKTMLAQAKVFGATRATIDKYTKELKESERTLKKCRKEHIKYNKELKKQKSILDGGGSGGLIGALGKYVLGVSAAVTAMAYVGYSMAKSSAAAEQQMVAFRNLAKSHGEDADQIINDLKKMSAQTVDTATLIQKAGTAIMLGVSPDKLSDLMEIARAASRVTEQTVGQAFDSLAIGIGRQSKLLIDNLGIVMSVEMANKKYAKQMNITGRELTDAEKKQAFLNETLVKGKDLVNRIGVNSISSMESFLRFEAAVEDLRVEVGKLGLALTPVIENLAMIARYWSGVFKPKTGIERSTEIIKSNIKELRDEITKIERQVAASALWGGKDVAIENTAEKKIENLRFQIKLLERDLVSFTKLPMITIKAKKPEHPDMLDYEKEFKIFEQQIVAMSKGVEKFDVEKALRAQELADQKLADHEKVLQFISTEEENEIRAINNKRELLLKLTKDTEEIRRINMTADEQAAAVGMSKLEEWAKGVEELKGQLVDWQDVAISAANSFSSGMTNAFFEFAEGTKSAGEAFKDFASSFLKQIAKMIMQQVILNALKSAAGSYFSKGGVVDGGEQTFTSGGVISQGHKMMEYASGGIVNKPTVFPMKNGLGLMGEAGPEAVMPLKRGRDGKLGVAGGGGNTINTTINVTTGGQGEDPEESKRRGRDMARVVEAEFNRNLTKQMRPGGILNQQ